MALGLRITGWVCFLGGGAFFFLTGATLYDKENLVPWAGMFVMLLGLILTSVSNLLPQIARMRRPSKPPEPPL